MFAVMQSRGISAHAQSANRACACGLRSLPILSRSGDLVYTRPFLLGLYFLRLGTCAHFLLQTCLEIEAPSHHPLPEFYNSGTVMFRCRHCSEACDPVGLDHRVGLGQVLPPNTLVVEVALVSLRHAMAAAEDIAAAALEPRQPDLFLAREAAAGVLLHGPIFPRSVRRYGWLRLKRAGDALL